MGSTAGWQRSINFVQECMKKCGIKAQTCKMFTNAKQDHTSILSWKWLYTIYDISHVLIFGRPKIPPDWTKGLPTRDEIYERVSKLTWYDSHKLQINDTLSQIAFFLIIRLLILSQNVTLTGSCTQSKHVDSERVNCWNDLLWQTDL